MSVKLNPSFAITPDKRQPPRGDKMVFGDVHKATNEAAKLSRLMKLDRALPKTPELREETLLSIETVWREVYKELVEDLSRLNPAIEKGLSRLDKRVAAIYKGELAKAKNPETLVRKFIKDAGYLTISPAKKSDRGNKGPTFLVNYPSKEKIRAYVAKWCPRGDQLSNRIYQDFSHCFSDGSISCGFSVPYSSRFDFMNHSFESATGNIVGLPVSDSEKIETNFAEFVRAYAPHIDIKKLQSGVMLSERVPGKNILDFSYTKYASLTVPQRMKFFERLGRMAMLDLIMGNLDRLIQVKKDVFVDTQIVRKGDKYGVDIHIKPESYILGESLETNLGNVMIVFKEGDEDFDLFAIDNGSEPELSLDQISRKKYLSFLNHLFSNPHHIELLVENIVKSFNNALDSQIDDLDLTRIELPKDSKKRGLEIIRERIQPLKDDLKTIAPKAFYLGLKKMADWMKQEVLNKSWTQSPRARGLQDYLQKTAPEHLESIQERLNTLNVRKL